MKKLVIYIIIPTVLYLSFAFCLIDLNPFNWATEYRASLIVLYLCYFGGISFARWVDDTESGMAPKAPVPPEGYKQKGEN